MFEEYKKALNQYAEFTGRSSRKEYWMFVLYNVLVSIAVGIVAGIIHARALSWLYSLAVIVPSIAISVRRLHDIGRSGWWELLCLIPIFGWIVLFVFHILDGQPETNTYGPNPKGV